MNLSKNPFNWNSKFSRSNLIKLFLKSFPIHYLLFYLTKKKGIIYGSHAVCSKTGHIILTYKNEGIEKECITYIGVMDEGGSYLKELWAGKWEKYYRSNGIRLMPFDDNKKILTGDYILECQPNIDDCKDSNNIHSYIHKK